MIELKGKNNALNSEEELNKLFDYYNKALFNNKLEKFKIEWNYRITRVVGRCFLDRKIIQLSYKHHQLNDYKELNNTLIHEMIHTQEFSHNNNFKRIAKNINDITGLNIQVYGGEENATWIKSSPYKYIIKCIECNNETKYRKNIVKNGNYQCGCGGNLISIEI